MACGIPVWHFTTWQDGQGVRRRYNRGREHTTCENNSNYWPWYQKVHTDARLTRHQCISWVKGHAGSPAVLVMTQHDEVISKHKEFTHFCRPSVCEEDLLVNVNILVWTSATARQKTMLNMEFHFVQKYGIKYSFTNSLCFLARVFLQRTK